MQPRRYGSGFGDARDGRSQGDVGGAPGSGSSLGASDADIPAPPWRRARRTPATRRPPLTQERIVDAALAVLDSDGLDAISMRRVGEKLGTGAASLYAHVESKDELLDLLLDRVIGTLEVPEPEPARWQEQVKQVWRDARSMMQRHRGVARLTLGRIPVGPNALRVSEGLLAIMGAGGVPDRVRAYASDLLPLYVGAFAYEETLDLSASIAKDRPPEEVIAMVGEYFASLPVDRFPNIVALVGELSAGDPDERFEFGLDLLVRGLAAYAD